MIYKIKQQNGKVTELTPLPFYEVSELNMNEKDLEDFLAENLLSKLFEDNALMPIYQERPYQGYADIYALTEKGDLVVFELKVGAAGGDAMLQILRYAQEAGQWSYLKLNKLYKKYPNKIFDEQELPKAHKEAFELDRELTPAEFNRKQHLYVVGSAVNEGLTKALFYWKTQGLSVEFMPYRIYNINKELYFEFFAKPNDIHSNAKNIKGVILDTNRTYNKDSVWDMLKKNRASAYGGAAYFANYINKNDYVFLSHRWCGIIAAGRAKSNTKKTKNNGEVEKYVDVEWLTEIPKKESGIKKYMSFSEVTNLLQHGFFWARTIKAPYLSKEESEALLDELTQVIENN